MDSEKKDCYHCKYLSQNRENCYCNYQKCMITVPGWGCLYYTEKEE